MASSSFSKPNETSTGTPQSMRFHCPKCAATHCRRSVRQATQRRSVGMHVRVDQCQVIGIDAHGLLLEMARHPVRGAGRHQVQQEIDVVEHTPLPG
jgi:hypothetical protein